MGEENMDMISRLKPIDNQIVRGRCFIRSEVGIIVEINSVNQKHFNNEKIIRSSCRIIIHRPWCLQ